MLLLCLGLLGNSEIAHFMSCGDDVLSNWKSPWETPG